MRNRGHDGPNSCDGTNRCRDSGGTRLVLGGGHGRQRLGLADAELALFQRGLKVRSDMTHQRDVAGGHHQGQQY